MNTRIRLLGVATLLVLVAVFMGACGSDDDNGVGPRDDTYDVDKLGIPKFVGTDYLELSAIHMISRFRSATGHNYSDNFETCRSMKHYFWPFGGDPGQPHTPSWTEIDVYSPVSGTVSKVFDEWAGTQIQIKSRDYPAFYFIIFHVALANPLKVGDSVTTGQLLGNHASDETMSDIAVGVNTPGGWKLVSYFDVITDSVFEAYQARGVASREGVIISKQARDADPLTCSGDTFTNYGTLEHWVTLN